MVTPRERALVAHVLTETALRALGQALQQLTSACGALGLPTTDFRREAMRAAYDATVRTEALLSQMVERIPR